jgi:hypothetical protein
MSILQVVIGPVQCSLAMAVVLIAQVRSPTDGETMRTQPLLASSAFVDQNPAAFVDAYWDFARLSVYE